MNSVSICGILITKNPLHTHFVFFNLLFSPVGLQDKIPAVGSQHIWTPFCTVLLVHLGNIQWNILLFSSVIALMFSGK